MGSTSPFSSTIGSPPSRRSFTGSPPVTTYECECEQMAESREQMAESRENRESREKREESIVETPRQLSIGRVVTHLYNISLFGQESSTVLIQDLSAHLCVCESEQRAESREQ
jgi:hypothetical protein